MSKSMWALDAPKRIALLVWALGILVSLGLGWSTSSDNRQAADRRLAEAATSVAQHVRERLTLYENGLRGTRDGAPVDLWATTTYVYSEGRWRVGAHQQSPAED